MKRTRGRKGRDSRQSVRCIRQKQWRRPTNINNLPHCLLEEILVKVNQAESKGRCRLVCKLWHSLIPGSDPPFALIDNITSIRDFQVTPCYASESSIFQTYRGFDFSYIPPFRKGRQSVCVQASCKDLLLCSRLLISQIKFYVVNPWTMEWIALPCSLCWRLGTFPVGLVAKTSPGDPAGYCFRVVRVTCIFSDFFEAEVFDQDVFCWSKVRVLHPYGLSWKPSTYQGLAYNGVLHWMVENGPIIAYDPFASPDGSGSSCCHFIMRNDTMRLDGDTNMSMKECITVSEGYIRMIQLVILRHNDEAHHLAVWKLKDCANSEWVLEHRVCFKDMVSKDPELQQYVWEFVNRHESHDKNRKLGRDVEPLACHPSNTHIVYMSFPGSISSIVCCNLLTKTLKLIFKHHVMPYFDKYDTAVPISASVQPTPVPKCPNNGSNHR